MEDLAIQTPWGETQPLFLTSNDENFCLFCAAPITSKNDSGWEYFRNDGVTTHKVCKGCDKDQQEKGHIFEKAEND